MDAFSLAFFNIFLFIFGASIGSFLNVLSDRLPNDESIMGRSHCEKCKHELSWLDLFPVASFFLLNGKCRYCKTKLSFFYPAVEIVTGIFFVLTWNFLPSNSLVGIVPFTGSFYLLKIIQLTVISTLLVIFFADWKYQIIPDSMLVILTICAGVLSFLVPHFEVKQLFPVIKDGVIVMIPILLLFAATRGRGMGFGDVKLAFVIGLLFGWQQGLVILYLSFIIGALAGVFLIFSKKKKLKSKIAFGPFIVIAMWLTLFFHSQLLNLLKSVWGI